MANVLSILLRWKYFRNASPGAGESWCAGPSGDSTLNLRKKCQRLSVFRAGVFALGSGETIASLERSLKGISSPPVCCRQAGNEAMKNVRFSR
jgi:hypothetical protein